MANKVGGRIVRIKLKGFMTYDDLEIHPAKGLNLIIGLNGSGKSSIMSAICLGLGGKPQFTGRSDHLSGFIKYGHCKAQVEIELESVQGKNDVIIRVILPDKQLWYLNNKIVHQSEITSIVKKYNIDMGNLCQFLPQEKVAEFSKMDKKQRLINMIQAIGDPSLVALFNELKVLRNNFTSIGKELDELENNKNLEQILNDRLKPDIAKQEMRVKLENELKVLRFEKMVYEYFVLSNKSAEIKEERHQLNNELSAMKETSNRLNTDKAELLTKFHSCQSKIQNLKADISRHMQNLAKSYKSLGTYHEEIDNAKINFENRMLEKEEQKAKLTALKTQIESRKNYLIQKKEQIAIIKDSLDHNQQEQKSIRQQLSSCHSNLEIFKLQKVALILKQKSKQAEVDRLSNEENKKYEMLRERFPDAYTALQWLNQNKTSFRANIFPPLLVSIKVHNDQYRKFIENTVSPRDLLMFVCEDTGDLERFLKIMKQEKKLSINVTIVPQEGLADFRSRDITNEMRNLGIQCYLKDLFTAPDSVMRILCKLNKVHQVPVCSETAEKNINSILNYSNIFFTTTEKISGKRSRYGNHSMSVKREVLQNRNILPNFVDNAEALNSAKMELQEIEKLLENIKPEWEKLETHRTTLERQQELLRNEGLKKTSELKNYADSETKLAQLTDAYHRKQKDVINEQEEKNKLTEVICNLNAKKLQILTEIQNIVKEIMQLKREKASLILYMSSLSEKLSSLQEKIFELEEQINNKKSRLVEANAEKDRLKAEGRKVMNEMHELRRASDHLKEFMVITPCEDIDIVEQKIINLEAQLELTNEDIAPIMVEFKNRQKTILRIEEDINSLKPKIEDLKIKIQKKKEIWLPPLKMHIENVNQKFSKYYKILKCAGEISLDQTDDTDDFPNYGLQLKLKYRIDEDFMELSQTHHSGGECSVAAIIFILSLQELTDVPFRCIDEINQGMDARNERIMYQLVADAARSGSCSQYFLLTPKLLMDLTYHKDVAVHTIFNSAFLKGKLDVKEHLKIARSNRL